MSFGDWRSNLLVPVGSGLISNGVSRQELQKQPSVIGEGETIHNCLSLQ
jgi:hypothetical protein